MSISNDLLHKKVLVLGAGVTGCASARALVARQAEVTLVDESVTTSEEFSIIEPSAVTVLTTTLFLFRRLEREPFTYCTGASCSHHIAQ
jgi:UDP-N-acetylmuramoylalanine-D-glutamate ligase